MYRITEADAALLAEYRRVPKKHHSLELRRLLNRLRIEPIEGKIVICVHEPHRSWYLARMGEKRGEPVQPFDNHLFTKLADAEWALLKLRWEKHSGLPLPAEFDSEG
ncbi:MAG: hypothetical protein WD044_04050 [Dongiaceae bacterium]